MEEQIELTIQRGSTAIQRLAKLKEDLNQALQLTDLVMMGLTETLRVDDPQLELLCSAHRSSLKICHCLRAVQNGFFLQWSNVATANDGLRECCPGESAVSCNGAYPIPPGFDQEDA